MKEQIKINSIRMLGVEMVNKANSGHPGIILGATPMIYALYSKVMKINSKDSKWINRDRFVLSAGHGSAMLYSMLYHSGYNIPLWDIKNFRKLNSVAAGHPEYGHTDGVDATTGPLGQGIAMAVGMAVAESYLNIKYPKIYDHHTYVICGDGDLQDAGGKQSLEFAGHNNLSKLIVLFDSNDIQLDNPINKATSVDRKKYIESINMDYHLVKDGESVDEIVAKINKSKTTKKASFIEIKTVIGRGSAVQGTSSAHGMPLAQDDLVNVRKFYDNENIFNVDKKITDEIQKDIETRNKKYLSEWNSNFNEFKNNKDTYNELKSVLDRSYKIDDYSKLVEKDQSTRVTSSKILANYQKNIPNMIGGSADLSVSTKIKGIYDDFPKGNNINFGVRDFSMPAITNGMQLHGGIIPFCSTFYVFSDFGKPSIRLAALMKIPTLFIFSHNSVFVGEDGPTHQPVEHNAMFRSMPNLNLFIPCDETEMSAAFKVALKSKSTPTVITTTRQNLESFDETDLNLAMKGGYILKKEDLNKKLDAIIIATGSEIQLAMKVFNEIKDKNIRIVSMPSTRLFDQQTSEYKEMVLPENIYVLIIEAGTPFGWDKYLRGNGDIIGIDSYGLSGPGSEIYKKFGFTVENIKSKLGGK